MKRYAPVILVFLLCGCGRPAPREHNTLRIRLKEDPTTLDPANIVDVSGGRIAAKIYDGLVRFGENGNIVPDLAVSWDVSGDKRVYTFRIRGGVRFSDGTALTAQIVKRSFGRIIADSPRKWIFDKVSAIRIQGSLTLQIVLKEPFGPFLSQLAMPNAYITTDGRTGTGPYKLAEWEHDKRILLLPNLLYSGSIPKVKGIEYTIIPEDFTAKTEFEMGNIDIMSVSPGQWNSLLPAIRKGKFNVYSIPGLNVYYIGLNCRKKMFKDVRVRQALNYAVNKKAVIDNVLYGQAEPARGPVPPGLLPGDCLYPYPFLPNKARRLLRGIGKSGRLKLYVRSAPEGMQIAEIIQDYLKKAGIAADIVPLEWSAFKKAVNEGEPDMFLLSWWADYPDPENFIFPVFYSQNTGPAGNRAWFKNSAIDRLILSAQRSGSRKLYEKLQRLISRQAPWIFLWHKNEIVVCQKRVHNFRLYPVYNTDKGTDVCIYN